MSTPMFGSCKHQWVETGRRYTPPRNDLKSFKANRGGDDTLLMVLYGFTVVEMTCQECGDLHAHTLYGDQRRYDE